MAGGTIQSVNENEFTVLLWMDDLFLKDQRAVPNYLTVNVLATRGLIRAMNAVGPLIPEVPVIPQHLEPPPIAAIPEPGAYLLMAAGLVMLKVAHRCRR